MNCHFVAIQQGLCSLLQTVAQLRDPILHSLLTQTSHHFSQYLNRRSEDEISQWWTEDKDLHLNLSKLKEYVWEEIHSVHWKEVIVEYRDCYSFVSYLHALLLPHTQAFSMREESDRRAQIQQAIRVADMGLLLGSPFFAVHLHGIIRELTVEHQTLHSPHDYNAILVNRDINFRSRKRRRSSLSDSFPHYLLLNNEKPIERIETLLSLSDFRRSYLVPQRPVILTQGITEDWEALVKWKNLDYFTHHFGMRIVPVETGESYLSPESGLKPFRNHLTIFISHPFYLLSRAKANASSGFHSRLYSVSARGQYWLPRPA